MIQYGTACSADCMSKRRIRVLLAQAPVGMKLWRTSRRIPAEIQDVGQLVIDSQECRYPAFLHWPPRRPGPTHRFEDNRREYMSCPPCRNRLTVKPSLVLSGYVSRLWVYLQYAVSREITLRLYRAPTVSGDPLWRSGKAQPAFPPQGCSVTTAVRGSACSRIV